MRGVRAVSKSDEQKMAKLVRKLSAKAAQQKPAARRKYDDTLVSELDDNTERRAFFSEMKKREF
jgi:hypothetical protein